MSSLSCSSRRPRSERWAKHEKRNSRAILGAETATFAFWLLPPCQDNLSIFSPCNPL